MGRIKEIYRDVRFFHGALQFLGRADILANKVFVRPTCPLTTWPLWTVHYQ